MNTAVLMRTSAERRDLAAVKEITPSFGAHVTKGHTEHVDQIAARLAVFDELTIAASKYEVVALEGCDGTGKTTIACNLAERHGYAVLHSDRPPGAIDLAERYR